MQYRNGQAVDRLVRAPFFNPAMTVADHIFGRGCQPFRSPPFDFVSPNLCSRQSAAVTGPVIQCKQRLPASIVNGFNRRDRIGRPSIQLTNKIEHIGKTAKKRCPETMAKVQSMAICRSHRIGRRSPSHYCGSKGTCRWILIHQRL